jgi:hypothetical protein
VVIFKGFDDYRRGRLPVPNPATFIYAASLCKAMQKRAQLSIFILLGAVLVIAVALLLYVRTPQGPSPAVVEEWAAPGVSALRACIDSTTKDAVALQMAQGGELSPSSLVPLPPMMIHLAVDSNGEYVPTLDDMADDLNTNLPALLDTCVDTVAGTVSGLMIDDKPAIVQATYNDQGAVVRVAMPVVFSVPGKALVMPAQVVTISNTNMAKLRSAAASIADDVWIHHGLPAGKLLDSPYQTSVINMGYGQSIVTLRQDNDVFNLAVREPSRDEQVRLFLGPASVTVDKGATTRRQLQLYPQDLTGIEFATNVPWATVTSDGWLVIDAASIAEDTYVVSLHASGTVQDDAVIEVTVA